MNRAKLSAAIKRFELKNGDVAKLGEQLATAARAVLSDRKNVLPGWSPTYLSRLGNIQTVVDVGVLNGTPSLYEAFPEAYLVLVEALPDYGPKCHEIVAARSGEVHNVAAGAEDATIDINQLEDVPARSSILDHVVGGSSRKRVVSVPLRKLDTLFADKAFQGDILLKIDTEGYEYNVILGASEFLKKVKYVIAETSVRRRHENSYRLADLVSLMKKNGFEVFDILTATREGANRPGASIVDVVFENAAMADSSLGAVTDEPRESDAAGVVSAVAARAKTIARRAVHAARPSPTAVAAPQGGDATGAPVVKERASAFGKRMLKNEAPYSNYGYGVYHAAKLAKSLQIPEISVIEFGVAGGNGLLALEDHAAEVERLLRVKIQVYGFDTGEGLTPPVDYRDMPYRFASGNYKMDVPKLQARLRRAKLVLGDVKSTAATFAETYQPAPIGFVSFDMDMYSSTMDGFTLFGEEKEDRFFLPRIQLYFDDILGSESSSYNDFVGELAAIKDFNSANASVKIAESRVFRRYARNVGWFHQIYVMHRFKHAQYGTYISRAHAGSLALHD